MSTNNDRAADQQVENGKDSSDGITVDVLEELPEHCVVKLARSLAVMCAVPSESLKTTTVLAPKLSGPRALE